MPHRLAGGGPVGDHGRMSTKGSPQKHRSPWRRFLPVGAAIVLLVVLAAGFFASSILDLEKHRESLRRALEEQTGWSAKIGAIDFSLWRGLVVTVGPLELEDPESECRLEARTVIVRASLAPLFGGRLEIDTVEILRPRVVVRVDGEKLPAIRPRSSGPGGDAGSALSVSIDEIHIKGGSVVIEAGERGRSRRLEIAEVTGLYAPSTERVWGRARIKEGETRIKWQGKLGQPISVDWEGLPSETLIPWLGEAVLRPGARIAGETTWSPSAEGGRFDAHLQVTDLLLLAGEKPLDAVTMALRVEPTDSGWQVSRLEIDSGHATVLGRGALYPLFDLSFEMPAAGPEHALALVQAIMPLPLGVSGEGEAQATFGVRMGEGEEILSRAEGALRAESVTVRSFLPEMKNFAGKFRLSEDNVLTMDDLSATVAGGSMRGSLRIEPAIPPGNASFAIDLADAAPSSFLAMIAPGQEKALAGQADMKMKIGVDLSGKTLSPAALRGKLSLESKALAWRGWDDLRQSLSSALESAAPLLGALGAEGATGTSSALENRWVGVDRIALRLDLDRRPWRVEEFVVDGGVFELQGEGSFAPSGAGVDMSFKVKLSPEVSAEILERTPWLSALANDDERLVLPVGLLGSLSSPKFSLDVERALGEAGIGLNEVGLESQDSPSLRGVLGSWLEKSIEKKRKKERDRKDEPQ